MSHLKVTLGMTSVSHIDYFTPLPQKKVPITHWKRSWVGPATSLDVVEKGNISCPYQELDHISSAVQPWCISKINLCVLQMYPNSYHHLTETDKLYYQDTVGHPTLKAKQTMW